MKVIEIQLKPEKSRQAKPEATSKPILKKTEKVEIPESEKTVAPKKKNRVLRFALNSMVYVAIVVGMIFGVPKFLAWSLDTPYPMAAITSSSMWPSLKEGDLIFIQGIERDQVALDDIIVFRNSDETFTIHRVIELEEDELTTKGDANFSEDEPIKYDAIVGKALMAGSKPVHIPYLGSITVYASNLK